MMHYELMHLVVVGVQGKAQQCYDDIILMLPTRFPVNEELRAIHQQIQDSPPLPPGTSLREWLSGLVFASAELMRDVAPQDQARKAVEFADDLIRALTAPKTLDPETLAVPADEAGLQKSWIDLSNTMVLANAKKRQERTTRPDIRSSRRHTIPFGTLTMPPPPSNGISCHDIDVVSRPTMCGLQRPNGRYSGTTPADDE